MSRATGRHQRHRHLRRLVLSRRNLVRSRRNRCRPNRRRPNRRRRAGSRSALTDSGCRQARPGATGCPPSPPHRRPLHRRRRRAGAGAPGIPTRRNRRAGRRSRSRPDATKAAASLVAGRDHAIRRSTATTDLKGSRARHPSPRRHDSRRRRPRHRQLRHRRRRRDWPRLRLPSRRPAIAVPRTRWMRRTPRTAPMELTNPVVIRLPT
jgi:hypothetical protein